MAHPPLWIGRGKRWMVHPPLWIGCCKRWTVHPPLWIGRGKRWTVHPPLWIGRGKRWTVHPPLWIGRCKRWTVHPPLWIGRCKRWMVHPPLWIGRCKRWTVHPKDGRRPHRTILTVRWMSGHPPDAWAPRPGSTLGPGGARGAVRAGRRSFGQVGRRNGPPSAQRAPTSPSRRPSAISSRSDAVGGSGEGPLPPFVVAAADAPGVKRQPVAMRYPAAGAPCCPRARRVPWSRGPRGGAPQLGRQA
jgi:hypothetical protein